MKLCKILIHKGMPLYQFQHARLTNEFSKRYIIHFLTIESIVQVSIEFNCEMLSISLSPIRNKNLN